MTIELSEYVIDAIADAIVKKMQEPRWTPVGERLPEDGTWNLFTDGKNLSVERYKSDAIDHFFPNGRWFSLEEAVAWMPLPDPYKEKKVLGHCKECKYFEYDSVAKVDGIPLIVAHEICNKWGDGCKTREDGYCFLFEPQESEE